MKKRSPKQIENLLNIFFSFRSHAIIKLFIISFVAVATQSNILDCTYEMRNYWIMGSRYACTARILLIGEGRNVTGVTQNHLPGRNDSHVEQIIIAGLTTGFMPRAIEQFFPNILSIIILNSELNELTGADLGAFPNLQEIFLHRNNLRQIDYNLFDGNSRMQGIGFESNPIRNVAHNVFDHLLELENLWFERVPCFNIIMENNRTVVEDAIFRLSVSCPPTIAMIEAGLLSSVSFQTIINQQVAERVDPLALIVLEIGQELKELRERVQNLEGNQTAT